MPTSEKQKAANRQNARKFMLAHQAEKHWRKINACKLILKVVEGLRFVDGELKEAA